ncbi:MAG: cell division protein FtsZ [Candidatus Aenigmarchaeota archaeon]|nr:cell division protein FtsZ [Candidatus Aenigmarchaeota archaeon]
MDSLIKNALEREEQESIRGRGVKEVVPGKENEVDSDLKEILKTRKAEITVVGCGGAGNNTIARLVQVGIEGAQTMAINTDAQDLLYTDADEKLLIGKEITEGLGAGANPKIGEAAAKESKESVKKSLTGSDMVFITCGLGGGTGTGSAPIVAEISKKLGALTVAICTLPFAMEGRHRMENAKLGLEKLEEHVDTLIVIPNDKLMEMVPDVSINTAFKVADEILVNAVKGIAELVTKPGLINLDFADIRAVMGEGGIAMIGMGQSDTENRAIEAVQKALTNPLLDVDIDGATGALINVTGGSDLTLKEAKEVVNAVTSRLSEEAKVIWGAMIQRELGDSIRAMVIVTGVQSPQIYGQEHSFMGEQKKEIEQKLGIDFV